MEESNFLVKIIDENIKAFIKPENHEEIVAEILGYQPQEKIYPPFTGCADEDRFCKAISLWYIERSGNRNLLGLFQTHGFKPNRNRLYNSITVTASTKYLARKVGKHYRLGLQLVTYLDTDKVLQSLAEGNYKTVIVDGEKTINLL